MIENRAVSDYKGIHLVDIGETKIIQGDKEGITIEASPELLKLIKTSVQREILTVKISNEFFTNIPKNAMVKYTIYVKKLNKIEIAANNYVMSDAINSKILNIGLNGNGVLNINLLKADEINVDISGNGECAFKGVIGKLNLGLSGSGIYNAKTLICTKASIKVSGSGKVCVNVVDSLSVDVSGSGIVEYKGNPKIEKNISGSGKVFVMNE